MTRIFIHEALTHAEWCKARRTVMLRRAFSALLFVWRWRPFQLAFDAMCAIWIAWAIIKVFGL